MNAVIIIELFLLFTKKICVVKNFKRTKRQNWRSRQPQNFGRKKEKSYSVQGKRLQTAAKSALN